MEEATVREPPSGPSGQDVFDKLPIAIDESPGHAGLDFTEGLRLGLELRKDLLGLSFSLRQEC